MNVKIHIPGFPRIGRNRELKKALEAYWSGKNTIADLLNTADNIKAFNLEKQSVLDYVTVGDYALYDHILNASLLFGNVPPRFRETGLSNQYDLMFAMARGTETGKTAINASGMTKWFNTNYHYIIPDLSESVNFTLQPELLLEEIKKAGKYRNKLKIVLPGPVTYLQLGKTTGIANSYEQLLDDLCLCYGKLFDILKQENISWIQIDEPFAALAENDDKLKQALRKSWNFMAGLAERPRLMLTTYFASPLESAGFISELPADGYHLDLSGDGDPAQSRKLLNSLDRIAGQFPEKAVLSLGVIDGRNIWKTDLENIYTALSVCTVLEDREIWLSTSCSLLHLPYTAKQEKTLVPELSGMLSFAEEKIDELILLKTVLEQGRESAAGQLDAYAAAYGKYKILLEQNRTFIAGTPVKAGPPVRRTPAEARNKKQREALGLPLLPLTSIGSFPQTKEIRKTRSQYRKGEISTGQYEEFIKTQIKELISWQESAGIDVLVHGEFERNDMVEYFSEALEGFACTDSGWVQSYGSRCVKPAIIFSDIKRTAPMTVDWFRYAQSLSEKPVKGMLTGPVTIIKWCFPRCDISFREQVFQAAEAVNREVLDLEEAGATIIQIDEAAFREARPLSAAGGAEYDIWAPLSFRKCAIGVKDETQIHTHMCYSNFSGFMNAVKDMDADVLTIEASRSEMAILKPFAKEGGFGQFGPGVYDVHSPEVPSVEILKRRIEKALQIIGPERLWINPDCGLKTRGWPEIKAAFSNIRKAVQEVKEGIHAHTC